MQFNPFNFILKSRIRASSFRTRFNDVYFTLAGNPANNLSEFLFGLLPLQKPKALGIFDYLTLGIPATLLYLLAKLPRITDVPSPIVPFYMLLALASFVALTVPRILFSIIIALAVLPIVAITHLIITQNKKIQSAKNSLLQAEGYHYGSEDERRIEGSYQTLKAIFGPSVDFTRLRSKIIAPLTYQLCSARPDPKNCLTGINYLWLEETQLRRFRKNKDGTTEESRLREPSLAIKENIIPLFAQENPQLNEEQITLLNDVFYQSPLRGIIDPQKAVIEIQEDGGTAFIGCGYTPPQHFFALQVDKTPPEIIEAINHLIPCSPMYRHRFLVMDKPRTM